MIIQKNRLPAEISFLYNGQFGVLEAIGNIALDIIGIVSLGLSTAAINDAKFIANVERRFTGYEHFLSMKYLELVHLGNVESKSSLLVNIFSIIYKKAIKIRENLKEIFE